MILKKRKFLIILDYDFRLKIIYITLINLYEYIHGSLNLKKIEIKIKFNLFCLK